MAYKMEAADVYALNVRISSVQWWNTLGSVFFVSGLILVFLSWSAQQIVPVVPFTAIGSRFMYLSTESLSVGVVGALLGIVIMLVSKLKLSSLSIESIRYRNRGDEDTEDEGKEIGARGRRRTSDKDKDGEEGDEES
ncbi:MAG: hypothetical protein KGI00_01815 [Candidatus Micrarchaeota archaeon]|nr:hypothetical protein [Candidatus Micrarchaeota archaeon]MDE1823864.1 hypothetical protein [Candidatus Micrarchaeota archaeon]MDE1849445.1 hypothetical protein [Candidatus Micrarchaeota archaeon]